MKKNSNFLKRSTVKTIVALFLGILVSVSCSDDDENPVAVDEEEVITTITLTLSASDTQSITLQSRDLDGDGPNAPEIIISNNLASNTTYSGSITLINETVTPPESISDEVAEEDEEHQFFFSHSGAISAITYADADGNGNPVGLSFTLTTGDAGAATVQVTLRHEPKKPNNGTLADAGGETDIVQNFSLNVE